MKYLWKFLFINRKMIIMDYFKKLSYIGLGYKKGILILKD